MLRTAIRIAVLLPLALPYASASVQKIAPDLYAYISENDASANSTFLISDKGILVVDTGLNVQEGRKLLEEIRKISPLPVRWIVNTHYHPDHRGGNSVVGPDALVISTPYTRGRIRNAREEQAVQNGQRLAPEYELNEVIEAVRLYLGNHEVRIYHPGPAHTLGDLVVYFPDQHAVATGDLFLTNSCPAMDDGDLENWVHALDQILALPVEHVVPGHFEVATKKELRHFRDYLAELRDQVDRMYSKGFKLAQVQGGLNLTGYDDLRQFPKYEATFSDNAAAYYGQLQRKTR
jgi:glyoxylase-like metal-dependent hydrolase (beta-lactamase superfamily II)